MSSTYSPSLRIELIGTGDQAGAWSATTNSNLAFVLDTAIAGYQAVTVTSTAQALTYVNGPSSTANLNQSVYAILKFNGAAAASAIYAPPVSKQYIIWNNSSFTITIYNSTVIGNTTAAGAGIAIAAGNKVMVWSDGTDFYDVQAQNLTGTLAIVNGGTGQTTANAAFNALAPAQTNNRLLRSNGTNTSFAQAVLTTDVTGTLPLANGGTGVTTAAAITALVGNLLFPVGALYSSTSATNPGTSLGFGTWAQFGAGRMMMGAGGSFGPGTTGGSNDATLPAHTHNATSTDSGHTHESRRNGTPTSGFVTNGFAANSYDGNNNSPIPTTTGFASITTTVDATGSSATNANLPPYIVVYMWQRTA
jgi:hypothetical protein